MTIDELINAAPRTTRLLKQAKFFFGEANIDISKFHRLKDKSAADFYSWKQDPEDIDFNPSERFSDWLGSGFSCWRDVRDLETAHFVGKPFVPLQKLFDFVNDLVWLDDKYPFEMLEAIGTLRDELTSDLEACLKNEAFGFPSDLYRDILIAYEQGGWPCGWLGKYPEGKMIVLDPNPK